MASVSRASCVSHVWKVNGLDHHVLEWSSSGDRPTAILVHGFHDAAVSWSGVAEGLAAGGFRVVAPDMRGFGDAARVPPGAYYYFPDYVADLAGIVKDHTNARGGPLFLVGHSMGATIVSYFAGAFPERLTKLALVDGVGPPGNTPDLAPVRMRRWIETAYESPPDKKPMTRAEAMARMSRFNPDLDEASLAQRVRDLARESDDGLRWKSDPLHSTVSPIPFFAESYKAFARLVTCPVLHVSGGAKGYHVPDEEERLGCFAKLTRVTLEGGHALHWTMPKELTDALLRFWGA